MTRVNNYLVQVEQAKTRFLGYDQKALIRKLKLQADETYVYVKLLCKTYRLHRDTGNLQRQEDTWVDANTHGEVMTLLDLICDSREDRHLACRFQNMSAFGRVFHSNLLESKDPFAELVQENQEDFCRACTGLQGVPVKMGDICYAFDLFDGLPVALQFWEGDEEFPPKVNILWDENALMYLKYETMWFAVGMLKRRILEKMKTLTD